MSGLLFESAWPLAAIFAITAVLFVAGALKTGRAVFLSVAVGMLLLAGGILLLERWVVTPREEVSATLHQIAADLQANDVPRVMQHVASSAEGLRSEIGSILPRLEIHRASVKPNLTVELRGGDPPTAAKAKFNGVIVASERRGNLKNQHGAFYFEVDFRREGDHWRVWNYTRDDPRKGIR